MAKKKKRNICIYIFWVLMGTQRFFFVPCSWQDEKISFFISLPGSKFTISLISIYKHYAIVIAHPSSMQDACHMNFIIDLTHSGVSVAQWQSIGVRNPKVWSQKPVTTSSTPDEREPVPGFTVIPYICNIYIYIYIYIYLYI